MKDSKIIKRNISFSGKKYKRSKCERILELMNASNADENMIRMLTCSAPVFSFTKLDDARIFFSLEINGNVMGYEFLLDKEVEMQRRNGTKLKLYFTMEGPNILHQTIKLPNGKYVYFTREFRENHAKMTIAMEGSDIEAAIYYDQVE